MISGADTLLSSGKTLTDGIAQLQGENNVNAQTLLKGAETLKSARKSLTSGMSQINSATGQITSGVETLALTVEHCTAEQISFLRTVLH